MSDFNIWFYQAGTNRDINRKKKKKNWKKYLDIAGCWTVCRQEWSFIFRLLVYEKKKFSTVNYHSRAENFLVTRAPRDKR